MILRFEEWLTAQQDREDRIGEFARVLGMRDVADGGPKHKGKVDEHRNWADRVIRMARPGYIDVFNEAWREFTLAKQTAKEPLE